MYFEYIEISLYEFLILFNFKADKYKDREICYFYNILDKKNRNIFFDKSLKHLILKRYSNNFNIFNDNFMLDNMQKYILISTYKLLQRKLNFNKIILTDDKKMINYLDDEYKKLFIKNMFNEYKIFHNIDTVNNIKNNDVNIQKSFVNNTVEYFNLFFWRKNKENYDFLNVSEFFNENDNKQVNKIKNLYFKLINDNAIKQYLNKTLKKKSFNDNNLVTSNFFEGLFMNIKIENNYFQIYLLCCCVESIIKNYAYDNFKHKILHDLNYYNIK